MNRGEYYFIHSYHVECDDAGDVRADTRYGYHFPSIIGRGNILGTQFHPEKSHRKGLELLAAFLNARGGTAC
jgi:glutamine amidotransferase